MKVLALSFLLCACALANQTPPGTATRPILTPTEAELYSKEAYLQGWIPPPILTSSADYIVGPGGFETIQAAVNAALIAGGTTRKYIRIEAGIYNEAVYVPNTNVPLTFYGAGASPADTLISLNLAAQTTPEDYVSAVNPDGTRYQPGDPAYSVYNTCATQSRSIGTSCSSVFFVQATNIQIANISIENTSSTQGDDQAVALQATNDKVQIDNTRLLGHQDTFCSGSGGNYVARSHVTNTYIEGDIDFVFGGGSTVFEGCTFVAKADRRNDIAVIFAPDTDPNKVYGYLVINSKITGDQEWFTSKQVSLARSWDSGVASPQDYVAGSSPNGQVVIRESSIDSVINVNAPYTSATSKRPFAGNVDVNRNLQDNIYNRFFEFSNTGDGA